MASLARPPLPGKEDMDVLDLEVSPPLYDGHHNTPRFGDVDTADLMINTMKRGFGHDDVAPKVR